MKKNGFGSCKNRRRIMTKINWFEDAGRTLDPKLVEHLRTNQKNPTNKTSLNEIPIIVILKKDCDRDDKEDLLKVCNLDSHNKLEKELSSINGLKGKLTPEVIKQIKNHQAVDRIIYDGNVTAF